MLVAIFGALDRARRSLPGIDAAPAQPIGTQGLPLGTDELGRDMLSRLIFGARLSLFMGMTPVLLALVIGSAIGVVAGYVGGLVNTVIMRTIDVFYAFPSVLLAVALSGALGAGITNGLISLTVVFIPPIARVAESVTTQVRNARLCRSRARQRRRSPVDRARPRARQRAGPDIRLRHEPDRGVDDPGLGPVVPRPGRQAARARMGPDAQHAAHRDLHPAAAVAALPGVMIFFTSISFNLLSDGLRSAMDIKA